MTEAPPASWIVLLGHGSRDPQWSQPLQQLSELLRRGGAAGVELAYLQLAEPTLEQALGRCRDAGAAEVLVVPVFLAGGGHLLRDVPQQVQAAATAVGGLRVRCAGAMGEEPEVLAGMVAACLRLAQ